MKIVYYFGAGASANAIPTVDKLRNRMVELSEFLTNFTPHHSVKDELKLKSNLNLKILNKIIEELKWLHKETKYHQTIDTFAKKLFLHESQDLKKLKRCLITYFFFEQSLFFSATTVQDEKIFSKSNLLDLRYDSLFANLIHRSQGKLSVDESVNIITWNYDLQIEMALKSYFSIPFNQLKEELNIHPNKNSYDNPKEEILVVDKFNVLKLNGNAFLDYGLQNGEDATIYDKCWSSNDSETIIKYYLDEMQKEFTDDMVLSNSAAFKYFNFAWENHDNFGSSFVGRNKIIDNAVDVIKNADVLIVVGYSFPTFNFEIDKKILSKANLKELIIQDEYPNAILERMKPLLKQLNPPHHSSNTPIKFTPMEKSNFFPIYKF